MGVQVTVSASAIDKQRLGYQAISLTHFGDTAEPSVATGSKVEISGALYEFTADETGTGWGGIGASNNVYILLTPSGASVSWSYTTTAPTWDTAKQGWYTGANRVIGGLYKDAGSLYTLKYLLPTYLGYFGKNLKTFITGTAAIWKCPYTGLFKVTAVGGGGGGGGTNNSLNVGTGGGGGGTAIKVYSKLAGDTFTYTVGAAGSAGSTGDGGNGGDTTVDDGITTITGSGGVKGTGAHGLGGLGGLGGTATNGDLNIPGGCGTPGFDMPNPYFPVIGGTGGASKLGAGGRGGLLIASGGMAGLAGLGYGGGGGGAAANTTGSAGGAGVAGIVIIEY